MKRSQSRILTTHTGSLPRPDDLVQLMLEREQGRPVVPAVLEARVRSATADAVRRQLDTGIDLVNDGEAGRCDYSTYVKDRLTGFGGEGPGLQGRRQDEIDFPGLPAARNRRPGQVPEVPGPGGGQGPGRGPP